MQSKAIYLRLIILALIIGLLGAVGLRPAHGATVQVHMPGGGLFYKKVESFKERRMRHVVPQSLDFSCGAAALATLMRYHFGLSITEREAIKGMFALGDRDEIRQRGFSLLEMKRLAFKLKYRAQGYKVPGVEKLKSLKIPVITLITTRRYKHFVVIRGVTDNFVYLADPSFGNRRLTVDTFDQVWSGVIFVITGSIIGDPEGLYALGEEAMLCKDQVIRTGGLLGYHWANDPTMFPVTFLWQGNRGSWLSAVTSPFQVFRR